MSKHGSCYYGDYFAEYSMRLCNHPKNKEHHSDANCRGCQLFCSTKEHRIFEIKTEILRLQNELKKLEKGR